MTTAIRLALLSFLLVVVQFSFAQGTLCSNAEPFCSDLGTATFPAGVNQPNAPPGNNYDCLLTFPNPAWYFLEIADPGNIVIQLTNSNNEDVDFILWGPYPDINTAQGQCGGLGFGGASGFVADCSYSANANETVNINAGVTGDVYILLITNFSNNPTNISAAQTSGTGSTDCTIVTCQDNAGTSSQALQAGSQSSDPTILCFGDVLNITHDGNQDLSGDPNASTASGIDYAIYNCSPTVSGTTAAEIAADPCVANVPPPGSLGYYVTGLSNIDGDATFINDGTYQNFFNGGAPLELFFGPTTLDDFANLNNENIGLNDECINVNTSGAFPVVFLNEILESNVNNMANGPCEGSFTIGGGMPEYDGSNYTSITLVGQSSGASGTVTSGAATHNSTVVFNVGEGDIYDVTVTDANGCSYTFPIDMTACSCPADAGTFTNSSLTVCWNDVFTITTNGDFVGPFSTDPATGNSIPAVDPGVAYGVWSAPPSGAPLTGANADPNFLGIIGTDPDMSLSGVGGELLNDVGGNTQLWVTTVALSDEAAGVYVTSTGVDPVIGDCYDINLVDAVQVTLLDSISYSINPVCQPNQTVNVEITLTGGLPAFDGSNFTVTGDGPGGTIANGGIYTIPNFTPNGTFSITVADAAGCSQVITGVALGIPNAAISIDNQPSCTGSADGILTASPSGAGYTFVWSTTPTQTNATAAGLAAGTYTVTITDPLGCVGIVSETLTDPAQLLAQPSSTNVSCFGGSDGTATVTGVGGTGAYTYSWNTVPVQTTQTISGLPQGSYIATVTDANGCVTQATATVVQPAAALGGSTVVTDVLCSTDQNGTATINATGGTQPYTYQWDAATGAQSAITATNLAPGTYSVTVTDANGCTYIDQATIGSPPPITTSVVANAASCFGQADGQATVTAGGGTPGYTYDWSDGQTTATGVNLIGGTTYFVFVTDANGCIARDSITIPSPPEIFISSGFQEATCFGGSDGFAFATATGGTPPFTYLWDTNAGSQTTDTAFNLVAGLYEVTITDAINCDVIVELEILEPSQIETSISAFDVLCKGDATGMLMIDSTFGGRGGDYTYQWDANTGSQTGDTAFALVAGTYFVTVTDTAGCTLVTSATITEPAEYLDGVLEVEDITCFSGTDGSVTYNVFGGVPPYQYSIDSLTFGPENAFVGLTAGDYTAYAVDNNGCVIQESVTLTQPQELIVDIQIGTDTIILGDSTQLIASVNRPQTDSIAYSWTFNPTGGLSCINCPNPYTAQQDHATYIVTATDESGCFDMDTVTIYIDKNRVVYVANAFTPNADNVNDQLFVQTGTGVAQVDRFLVYDRWGELVFESADTQPNDPSQGWDGTFKGKAMNQAVFAWYAEVTFIDGYKVIVKGDVQLLR